MRSVNGKIKLFVGSLGFIAFLLALGVNLYGQEGNILTGNENTLLVPLNLNGESFPLGASASSEEKGGTAEQHVASSHPHGGSTVTAHPNRPSVSDSPNVLPPGQLQIEYGLLDSWLGGGNRHQSLGGILRFGLARNLEVRWGWDQYSRASDSLGSQSGMGDNWLGAQYRFLSESHEGATPSMALSYTAKLPTADHSKHLGSGRTDHFLSFLVGKDLWGMEWDINGVYRVIGREGGPGYDANGLAILTFGRGIVGPVGFIGEGAWESRLNHEEQAFGTTLWALTYRLTPRLVLDAGIEVGLSSHAPRKHVIFGFTYAIGNLYSSPKRRHHSAKGTRGH